MTLRMSSDRVAFAMHPADQLRIAMSTLAEHEERCTSSVCLEDVENLRGEHRIRPIVKRQGDDRLVGRQPADHRDEELTARVPDRVGEKRDRDDRNFARHRF